MPSRKIALSDKQRKPLKAVISFIFFHSCAAFFFVRLQSVRSRKYGRKLNWSKIVGMKIAPESKYGERVSQSINL